MILPKINWEVTSLVTWRWTLAVIKLGYAEKPNGQTLSSLPLRRHIWSSYKHLYKLVGFLCFHFFFNHLLPSFDFITWIELTIFMLLLVFYRVTDLCSLSIWLYWVWNATSFVKCRYNFKRKEITGSFVF